jgi:two-component sensor histidine kinase
VIFDRIRDRWVRTTFRVRIGLALALALAPVLLLSLGQSALTFQNQARDQRADLVGAARRSAEIVRTRMEAGQVLLQSLAPSDTGGKCAARLAAIKSRVPDFANLIRFDAKGDVLCSAAPTPVDPGRAEHPWFRALATGAQSVIASDPGHLYATTPALLASAHSADEKGAFTGALTAVMTLTSLRPESVDSGLPPRSQVAVVDVQGDYLSSTDRLAFPSLKAPTAPLTDLSRAPWFARDGRGERRIFTAAPLVGNEVWVVISAPTQGVVAWAWLNPISALVLPLLAFVLAVGVVWSVADRGVVRWIAYLRRIASIYGRGRFGVHPLRASRAPPEIRDLAEAMDSMAAAIATRDALVQETLAQKDSMMREIHHRVKNNLQVISSLLNMQQRGLTDPAARAAIQDTRQRISALALIYRALYEGPDMRSVDLSEFLDELIGQIIADAAPGARIRTELHLEPLSIDPDRLAPLALFAVEAITNARKHGLSEGGLLEVSLAVTGGSARLDISDSGLGPNPAGGLTTRLIFPTPSPSEAA